MSTKIYMSSIYFAYAFVFTSGIVQSSFFLNSNFQASSPIHYYTGRFVSDLVRNPCRPVFSCCSLYMSHDTTKPVFGVSDKVRHKLVNTVSEKGQKLGYKKKRDCTIHVAKTKALISCAVTAQMICAFVFV